MLSIVLIITIIIATITTLDEAGERMSASELLNIITIMANTINSNLTIH